MGGRVAAVVVLVGFGVKCSTICDRKLGKGGSVLDVEDLVGLEPDVGDLVGLAADLEDLGAVFHVSCVTVACERTNVWSIWRAVVKVFWSRWRLEMIWSTSFVLNGRFRARRPRRLIAWPVRRPVISFPSSFLGGSVKLQAHPLREMQRWLRIEGRLLRIKVSGEAAGSLECPDAPRRITVDGRPTASWAPTHKLPLLRPRLAHLTRRRRTVMIWVGTCAPHPASFLRLTKSCLLGVTSPWGLA